MGCCSASQHVVAPMTIESTKAPRMATGEVVTVRLVKQEGVPLGLAFMNYEGTIVVTSVAQAGNLQEWNLKHEDRQVLPGDVILSVNGISGEFWEVAAEVWKPGQCVIKVQKTSQQNSIARSASRLYLQRDGVKSRVPLHGPVDHLPHICSSDLPEGTATECAICLDDFEPETRIVQLPCKHTFHPCCAARWLATGAGQCPLCRSPGQEESH